MRAMHVFQGTLAGAFLASMAFVIASWWLHATQGDLTVQQTEVLLGLLYWGTYPLVFVALGSLTWHFVRFYRGDYA